MSEQQDSQRNECIRAMIDRRYAGGGEVRPCWAFCQEIWSLYDRVLPDDPRNGLKKIDQPEPLCVALFALAGDWHAGIVWPDGLHFIHAAPTDERGVARYVRKDRLTVEPWSRIIKGYYVLA
ncbi:MAG: hypothetical protein JXM79_11085 [Sedimentisphaerales bacterium]|nr:hypothetical protein [Sedimentisphaerales bacterium]